MALSTEHQRLAALVGRENAKRLRKAGVPDLAWLLRIARTPEGRQQLANHAGVGEGQLLEWAHFADLCRVREIDDSSASLLQKVGVRSLRDLVAAEPRGLCTALRRLDAAVRLELSKISGWVRAARQIRPGVHDEAPPRGAAWGEPTASRPLAGLEGLGLDPNAATNAKAPSGRR